MRKFLALGFVLIAALILSVGFAQAVGVDEPAEVGATLATTGVKYEWGCALGTLTVAGEPGQDFEAFDATGRAVAHGLLHAPFVDLVAPNVGFGPDGVIMHVRLGSRFLAITDPEWEWN